MAGLRKIAIAQRDAMKLAQLLMYKKTGDSVRVGLQDGSVLQFDIHANVKKADK